MRDLDLYETDYNNLPFEDRQVFYRQRKILEELLVYKPNNILEIGCGKSPLFEYYDDFMNLVVVEPCNYFFNNAVERLSLLSNYSLDASNNQYDCNSIDSYRRLTFKKNKKEIHILNNTIEAVSDSLINNSIKFDFIVLASLLHEVHDCSMLLESVKLLTNKDTILHVNVPNALSIHRRLAVKMGLIDSPYNISSTQKMMQQHHTFDLESLEMFLEKCGFYVINKGTFFIKPFTHKQMSLMLEFNIINESTLDGFYELSSELPHFGSEIFMNAKLKN